MNTMLSSRRTGHLSLPKPINMLPAGDNVYIGFCENNVTPHYLVVGNNLFIFLSSKLDVADMVRSVQEVLGSLSPSCGWQPADAEAAIRLDWIAQAMSATELETGRSMTTMPRRRLSPA